MSLANKLAEERRGRLAAERLLELKQAELFAANRKLGEHAKALSHEIVETRAEVATVRDENQRVKSDLSAAHEKIELVERRLWHSIETINDGFAFFTPDLEMIMANRSYLAVFDKLEEIQPGVSYVTILQVLTDEGIVNTGDTSPAAWRQMMIERVQSPHPEPVIIRLWNGEYIKMIDQRGPDGDIISLGLNITATVKYEEKLKAARESAEIANRAKSAFLANMSHEIRTPMNGVVGMADVLGDTPLSEEQRLYVDTIKNSGEALLVIINDVLDYSKIEAERLDLHPEPFDLEQSILEIIMLLQSTAKDKGLDLILDYDLMLPSRFVGDPGRMRQILTNLLGNAVKFTQQGHVTVKVRGTPDAQTGKIALSVTVEDTGIGIAEDMIEHVFGEFNQVENERNRQFDGTGLGLAITKRLIKMMGGRIWLTSEEGVGSCFGFEISFDAPDGLQAAHPALPATLRHVMVVDDFEPSRIVLRRQIEELGLKATACEDAASALALLDRTVDVVLVDHIMPEMNGVDFARTARDAGHAMPIYLLSSNVGHAHAESATGVVNAISQKPLPRRDVMHWLSAGAAAPTDTDPNAMPDLPLPTFSHRRSPDAEKPPVAGSMDIPADSPADTPDTSDTSAADTPKEARRMRVLAAEDNKTNQLVLRKMLKDFDIDLTFANDGVEAVEAHGSFDPDLIFMDISMPRMDGKEATQTIRRQEQETGRHVPIIALTAHAMQGDNKDILAVGLDHYMSKPVRKAEMHAHILNYCPADAMHPRPDMPDQEAG
ncbi:response regulator [Roseobacter sp. YSTF-M11]|uniref:Sensory/regulatory protein RpfC n=1 Tax=Roseobacter insulae TaxID=2859783 RepID=A0A9X1K0U6_9RHOB|nr:response regulator [Roseobacter insulae]MBW4706873.1 response regulator [Roseobacter insulae]